MIELNDIHKIHFVGIGGVSMSGIAEILNNNGYQISGSDRSPSILTEKLQSLGINVTIGHDANVIADDIDLVVYTSAISEENPELVAAKKNNIPLVTRAEMLGTIMTDYDDSIAVAGTHGKTTTTSMIASIIADSELDPTILVGGYVKQIDGFVRHGKGDVILTESCEYKENFLEFYPNVSVILNIDEDHLDYYTGIDHILKTFISYAGNTSEDGVLILNADDFNCKKLINHAKAKILTFGINQNADIKATNIVYDDDGFPSFTLEINDEDIIRIALKVPGEFNILNALAAISTAHYIGLPIEVIAKSIESFTGAGRRFEFIKATDKFKVYDDYAHHPTAIKATLKACQKLPHEKIICIYQPHTYSRTKELLMDFATSFADADRIILTDIYAAREDDPGDIHSRDLVELINDEGVSAIYLKDFQDIIDYVNDIVGENDIVLTMGAGTITNLSKMF